MTAEAPFVVQPYPLFAVTVEVVDNPPRFEATADPVRLVLGWKIIDGVPHPLLDTSRDGEPWTGPVLYRETRALAENVAKDVDKFARSDVRSHTLQKVLDKVDNIVGRA